MKRLTKAQREARDRAALHRRITDIVTAANFGAIEDDTWISADVMSRTMLAVRDLWGLKTDCYLLGCHMLEHWDSIENIVELLWSAGLRADGTAPEPLTP